MPVIKMPAIHQPIELPGRIAPGRGAVIMAEKIVELDKIFDKGSKKRSQEEPVVVPVAERSRLTLPESDLEREIGN